MIKTSYISRAKYLKIQFEYILYISGSIPSSLTLSENERHIPELSPGKFLFYNYKNGSIDWEYFKDGYKKRLDTYYEDTVKSIVELHKKGKSVCLVCYEKDNTVCHRSILAEYIKERYNIDVEEYRV